MPQPKGVAQFVNGIAGSAIGAQVHLLRAADHPYIGIALGGIAGVGDYNVVRLVGARNYFNAARKLGIPLADSIGNARRVGEAGLDHVGHYAAGPSILPTHNSCPFPNRRMGFTEGGLQFRGVAQEDVSLEDRHPIYDCMIQLLTTKSGGPPFQIGSPQRPCPGFCRFGAGGCRYHQSEGNFRKRSLANLNFDVSFRARD